MNSKGVVSVICEYNPLHFGHLYQLNLLKEQFGAVVCILSGDIVQRGSISVASKYLRAEAAIKSGANLVLELPLPYSCASARDFAAAGVHIAEAIGSDFLAFGAEDSALAEQIFAFISQPEFGESLKKLIQAERNVSYPTAVSRLVEQALGEEAAAAVAKPNNILALEYFAAMQGKRIKPFPIKRSPDFESSSQIRAVGGKAMLARLPETGRAVFAKGQGDFPRDASRLDAFFIGALRMLDKENIPENLYSAPRDLVNKLLLGAKSANSVEALVEMCVDKSYTAARVRRAVNSVVFGIEAERVKKPPCFTTLLAADKRGCELLGGIRKSRGIEIITKPASVREMSEEIQSGFAFSEKIESTVALSASERYLPNSAIIIKE